MQCGRCGTIFDGRFCPRCGAPAVAAQTAPPAPTGWPCPRCGTLFYGNFCPRCGLPTAAWAYQAPPSPSGGRSVLSVLWTLALVAFIAFALTDFAALVYGPAFVVPGIQGIASGQTVNGDLNFNTDWVPNSWGTGSSLSYQAAGGNPGGYLRMSLPSSGARGYWMQSFQVTGSVPYTGAVRLDMEISGGLTSGWLFVSVVGPLNGLPPDPDPNTAVGAVHFSGPTTAWTTTPRFFADASLGNPGTYYLQVAFVANTTTSPVVVGFDNIRLAWTTDAVVWLFYPTPTPQTDYYVLTQDKNVFVAYYSVLVAAILLAAGYHLIRERKETWNAFKAPLEAIGRRLKSRSAWIAVAQVWMAVTFFQIVAYYFSQAAGLPTTTPITITSQSAWVWLYNFANAGVYEEFAFRLLLIGAPMAVGSVIMRIFDVRRGGWNGAGSAVRHVAGAWRYLIGGTLRNDAPKETLVAAWAFLFASSAIFGLAHAPGWGVWKVIPAAVAGLGFGYLFLRHGIGAAILAHFVNDYALTLSYEGVGGDTVMILIELLVLGLAIAGAGFFAWYAIDAWRHFRALVWRFRPPPARTVAGPAPPSGFAAPVPPAFPSPPDPGPSMPPPQMWAPNASVAAPAAAVRNPGRIPRDYTPTYVPPPYGYPPVRFQCPYCGWVEARYDSGRFTCTRCGRTA